MTWLLIAIPLGVAGLGILVAFWVTADGYRGVHTGQVTGHRPRHQATGLDDPTTQIIAKGQASVEDRTGSPRPS